MIFIYGLKGKFKMKCKNCNSENITVMTEMTVSMPFDFYRNLTKKKMQTKDFKVWSVNWGASSFICKDCGYTIDLSDK